MRATYTIIAACCFSLGGTVRPIAQDGVSACEKDKNAFAATLIERAAIYLTEQEHKVVSV